MAKQPKPVVGVYEREPGSGLWHGRYRTTDGKLVRKSFGKDRQAAVEWAEKARTIRRTGDGVLPATAKRHPRTNEELERMGGSDVNLAELCDDFERYVLTHPDEYRDQKNPPRRIQEIKKAFGERPASGIRTEEIEDWLDAVQEDRELANATLNKLRGTFSKIYRHGKRRGKVAVNPAGEAELRPVSDGIERFLSIEEEKRLRAVLQADIDTHANHPELRKQAIHRMVELDVSLRSGMRKSEQFNLRWSDVDFDRRIMRLRKTKNGKPRNAFIIEDVAAALRTLKELGLSRRGRTSEQKSTAPADSVFAKGDNKKWWLPALKKARITKYRWHDNRHTFCSRLVQAGVHLKVVQEAAGHKSIASTMRYAHFAPSQVVDAMAVLNWPKTEQAAA